MKEYEKLAKVLINYSCDLHKGEKVLIDQSDCDPEFIVVLINEAKKVGAYPFVFNNTVEIEKATMLCVNEEYAKLKTKYMLPIMKDMDAYIGIRGVQNASDFGDIPIKFSTINDKYYLEPVHIEERVAHTKWVILRWITPGFAQNANLSTNEFTKFFFDVCTLDYQKMADAMTNLQNVLTKTNKVRIVSPNTDLTFSINGIPNRKCCGKRNIPDGEVFTAPVKTSVNGKINYNIPTIYNGIRFDNVCLEIKEGKIIKASCNGDNQKLNAILDSDEGARYFGEFALGVNPKITRPMLSILFDEKISGSIHLTPGSCYDDASNGNKSSIHWDMVLCQLPEYGGGEIYFDDILIRKDGKFVLDELKCLNPENLL